MMNLLEKILVPTDFHGSADKSIEMAIDLAKRFNSEIILLHVLIDNPDLSEYEEIIKQEVDRKFQTIHSKISGSGIKKVSQVISKGNKSYEINKIADEKNVNLIIMGSGKMKGKGKSQLGTITKRVIESSTKPIWVMTEQSTQSINSILCPVDFSAPSHHALANAIHLARYFRSKLTVLTVNESFVDMLEGIEIELQRESDSASKEIENKFDKFLKEFDFHEVQWEKKICQGKPHIEILKAIEGKESETLLVMGTTGKTGFSKFLVGSVTEKVTRELPCSFITMKEEDFIALRLNSELTDLESHFQNGKEMLANGLPKEALNQFKLGISINDLHAPSWDGMAVAYDRLQNKKNAENSRKHAQEIRTRIDEQKIVAEIRSRSWMVAK
ncbi:MAG: universal stress protein [Cyclobacteriaceae bacterium]